MNGRLTRLVKLMQVFYRLVLGVGLPPIHGAFGWSFSSPGI